MTSALHPDTAFACAHNSRASPTAFGRRAISVYSPNPMHSIAACRLRQDLQWSEHGALLHSWHSDSSESCRVGGNARSRRGRRVRYSLIKESKRSACTCGEPSPAPRAMDLPAPDGHGTVSAAFARMCARPASRPASVFHFHATHGRFPVHGSLLLKSPLIYSPQHLQF